MWKHLIPLYKVASKLVSTKQAEQNRVDVDFPPPGGLGSLPLRVGVPFPWDLILESGTAQRRKPRPHPPLSCPARTQKPPALSSTPYTAGAGQPSNTPECSL